MKTPKISTFALQISDSRWKLHLKVLNIDQLVLDSTLLRNCWKRMLGTTTRSTYGVLAWLPMYSWQGSFRTRARHLPMSSSKSRPPIQFKSWKRAASKLIQRPLIFWRWECRSMPVNDRVPNRCWNTNGLLIASSMTTCQRVHQSSKPCLGTGTLWKPQASHKI